MRFGCWLPNYGPLSDYSSILGVAKKAEELGFDSVAIADHIFMEPSVGETHVNVGSITSYTENFAKSTVYDAFVTLANIAGKTNNIRLLTNIYLLALRNPLLVAKEASTLDVVSQGRLTLGVASGWYQKEFDIFNVPWKERGKILDENIRALKTIWTSHKSSFHGKYTQFNDIESYPKPIQKPHPPIWIGGYISDGYASGFSYPQRGRVLRRVSELGDGWLPVVGTTKEIAEGREMISTYAKNFNRKIEDIVIVAQNPVSISNSKASALEHSEATLMRRFGTMDQILERALVGSPSDVSERLDGFVKSGANYFIGGFIAENYEEVLKSMSMFAKEVFPSF